MKPLRYSLLLVFFYAVTAGAYIWLSGAVAARLASDVLQLAQIERLKGLIFVSTTAGLLFLASWLMFRRLSQATLEREQLRQSVMMAQSRVLAGELAATVAHDFNNALMVVQYALEEAQSSPTPNDKTHAVLREASDAAEYARQLSLRLANTARGQRILHSENRNLSPIVKSVVRALSRLPRLRASSIQLDLSPEAIADADAILFEQILSNLVLNAADAAGAKSIIRILLASESAGVRLEVHDNGPGIPVERRKSVFTAFETSKPDGLGLGLLSVRVAVQVQGGTVSLETSPLGGAAFVVRLPRKTSSGADELPRDSSPR